MDSLMTWVERFSGQPAHTDLHHYLGPLHSSWIAHSNNPYLRDEAASGGIVSQAATQLLETGLVDGVIESRLKVTPGGLGAEVFIAENETDVLSARASIYMDFPWLKMVLNLLEDSKESARLAVVGLPCQLTYLDKALENKPELQAKILFKIGLVCGGNASPKLISQVLERQGIDDKKLKSFCFRRGHWRGNCKATTSDGEVKQFAFGNFSLYRNLHCFGPKRCLFCTDPLALSADLVCGDIWMSYVKKRPIKPSLVLIRTAKGETFWQNLIESKQVAVEALDSMSVYNAQRRLLNPARRGFKAKVTVGKILGIAPMPSSKNTNLTPRLYDYITAFAAMLNHQYTEKSNTCGLVWRTPKPVLKLYMAGLSFLKHL